DFCFGFDDRLTHFAGSELRETGLLRAQHPRSGLEARSPLAERRAAPLALRVIRLLEGLVDGRIREFLGGFDQVFRGWVDGLQDHGPSVWTRATAEEPRSEPCAQLCRLNGLIEQ